jgi:hypothetical protein
LKGIIFPPFLQNVSPSHWRRLASSRWRRRKAPRPATFVVCSQVHVHAPGRDGWEDEYKVGFCWRNCGGRSVVVSLAAEGPGPGLRGPLPLHVISTPRRRPICSSLPRCILYTQPKRVSSLSYFGLGVVIHTTVSAEHVIPVHVSASPTVSRSHRSQVFLRHQLSTRLFHRFGR